MVYVQFSDELKTAVVSVFGSHQDPIDWPNQGEVDDDDPRYLAYIRPQPSSDDLALSARTQRDTLLRTIYDTGINMALRAARTASTPEGIIHAESKIAELDAYAELLLEIPNQPGFPLTIIWPDLPSK